MTDWLEVTDAPNFPENFFENLPKNSLGNTIIKNYKHNNADLTNINIVIIGVPEDKFAAGNSGSAMAPDAIREQLFLLMNRTPSVSIADLGNIRPGATAQDTYVALSNILAEMISNNILTIILGGSNDIAYANYLAYEKLEKIINITSVDARFDLGSPDTPFSSQAFLNRIVVRQPNYLFNYTNVGYQSYFADHEITNLMNQLFFDSYRVGIIRNNPEEAEPLMRNADMLSVDISAVRQSDAPGNEHASPNGFYGEEICRICRYAGMSDKLSTAGFYEVNPLFDRQNQTARLTAQMIWFLIEGFSLRKHDNPRHDSDDYVKYHVFNKKIDSEILFFKSKKSGRWWMEVHCPAHKNQKFNRHYLVACSFKDYQTALADELPDRWWQTYQKIM
jgi:formiminoglutamase